MKQEDSIQQKYGKDSGMRVPDGYFTDLQSRIIDTLPPYESQPVAQDIRGWQRFKPYFYLAAMFAGIWLMMKVFHTVSQPMSLSLDNPPEAIVQLIDSEAYTPEYLTMQYIDDYDIEEEVVMSYDSFEEFERDFDSAE